MISFRMFVFLRAAPGERRTTRPAQESSNERHCFDGE
jgi:hypothetical protein